MIQQLSNNKVQRASGTFYYIWASLLAQAVKNPPAMQEIPVQFLGWEDPLETGQATHSSILGTRGGSVGKESIYGAGDLGWENPLEKGTAIHSSILAWRIPRTMYIQSMGSQRVRHD